MSLTLRQRSGTVCGSLKFRCSSILSRDIKRNLYSKFPSTVSLIQVFSPITFIKNEIQNISNWYEEVSGLKEVKMAQDKVSEASEKLAALQEKRRQCTAKLRDIQNQLKEIYSELDNTKRGEDRYVQLISEENKWLKEERMEQVKFTEAEKEEREQFTTLMSAVKSSHDKERFHSKKTQYWSLIGSAIGAVIGTVGASINNHRKHSQFKELILKTGHGNIREELEQYRNITETIAKNISNSDINNHNLKSIHELLTNLSSRLVIIEEENRKQLRDVIISAALFIVLTSVFLKYAVG